MTSRIISQTPVPDDIYYVTIKLKSSSLPQSNTKFPFHDMTRALVDIRTHKEKIPERDGDSVYIRASTPHLTWYEAKTRELLMKYALNCLKETNSWKVDESNKNVSVKSDNLAGLFTFKDELMPRLKGTHAQKLRIGAALLTTAHAYFQEQRVRHYPLQYEEKSMPLLEFDPNVVELTYDERNIQTMYKAENMVFEEAKKK
mmetsp:Transcript_5596/g.21051  ORF Transcript_5596/g.21051 Transcript_5596/m.21051 type:complete len:201 (-) Transcript_5596:1328-1930(-)|eukprot:CAMPEP_0117446426 /NCGR_PEP_ID=MMETSP0759-20121206/6335_1 /TAXON_ID=63605 /ORGANISM="Percolomonas cosmopolitus, Strain WS" /LENGTH=200 /DNA_ID=CAMNT_0005238693 /DNA_START=75 /DNA_END=677 /DNA_ORIENTATION=+